MSAEEMKRGIRTAYADGAYTGAGQDARLVEFDRMIAEVERATAARALDLAADWVALMGTGKAVAELRARAAQDAAPQDNGKCGGCRDLGPHRNVPGCQYYEAPVLPTSGVDEAAEATLNRVRALLARAGTYGPEEFWEFKRDLAVAALAPVTEEGDGDAAKG